MSTRTGRATRPRTAAALALSAGLLQLAACSGNDATSNGASPSAAASPSSSPSVTVKTVGFDETYRTSDDVSVQISEIKVAKLGLFPTTEDPDAKEGDPYIILTTKTTNGTKSTLGFALAAVLKYGPNRTQAAQVLVLPEEEPIFYLDPNEAGEYRFGFIIPSEFYDQAVMKVTVSIDPLRTAVFSGSITPT
ncbi:hypothetical protein GCM10009841_02550 [Microlunatus panaciterrae]|uniref:DUF4352 domain-containing protein n=1 Tax=Microlunatus panaciterrae TaxID=400768 RepID=A0ABS2RLN0_9ACTN|nr:hypothetical protein [Microlunatus panaciterrae]MBM7799081.1 hypothetical protein [Microlunatus panaciterrae]